MDFSFPLLNHFQYSNNRMKLHWNSLNVRINNETQTYDLYKRRIWRLLLFDLENRGTLSRFFARPFRGHWFTQTRSLCSAILSTRGNFNENQRITYRDISNRHRYGEETWTERIRFVHDIGRINIFSFFWTIKLRQALFLRHVIYSLCIVF